MPARVSTNRRQNLIDAGLAILREEGLSGLSQPAAAARAGLRQSHLTYYFPTRHDLLAAVARAAIHQQLEIARAVASRIKSVDGAAAAFATAIARHENTRVLVALNQAADQDSALQELFNELLDGFGVVLHDLLERLGLAPTEARVDIVHALFVGLSVIDLATSRPRGRARSTNAWKQALALL